MLTTFVLQFGQQTNCYWTNFMLIEQNVSKLIINLGKSLHIFQASIKQEISVLNLIKFHTVNWAHDFLKVYWSWDNWQCIVQQWKLLIFSALQFNLNANLNTTHPLSTENFCHDLSTNKRSWCMWIFSWLYCNELENWQGQNLATSLPFFPTFSHVTTTCCTLHRYLMKMCVQFGCCCNHYFLSHID